MVCILQHLTHQGRVTHICVGNLTIIGSDAGLSPGRHQDIIWTDAGILLIGPLGTNFREISIEMQTFSFKKMRLKMSSAKWRPSCLGLIVLRYNTFLRIVLYFNPYACTQITWNSHKLRWQEHKILLQMIEFTTLIWKQLIHQQADGWLMRQRTPRSYLMTESTNGMGKWVGEDYVTHLQSKTISKNSRNQFSGYWNSASTRPL